MYDLTPNTFICADCADVMREMADCFRTACAGYKTKEQERASHSEVKRGISFEEWWADYDDFDCSQIKCNGNCSSSCQAVSKRAWEAALKNRR